MEAKPTIVTAPDPTPVPYGLFSAVPFRTTAERWYNGATVQEVTPNGADHFEPGMCTPEDAENPLHLSKTAQGLVADTYATFSVTADFQCSPIGLSLEDAEQFAARALTQREEREAEARVWAEWTASGKNALDHRATAVTATGELAKTVKPKTAQGILEHHLVQNYGGGVIHAPRWLSPHLDIAPSGGRMLTTSGIPVVLGAGYGEPGTATIVATPTLFGYRSEIQQVGEPEQVFDRGHNVLQALAIRDYLIGWTPYTPIKIDITTLG